jgi:2-keto-3-deoxy-L-rhamnonate aldolase RhmA
MNAFLQPKAVEAVEAVREPCGQAGVAPGIRTRGVEVAGFWKQRGMRLVGCGSESGMFHERACQIASQLL